MCPENSEYPPPPPGMLIKQFEIDFLQTHPTKMMFFMRSIAYLKWPPFCCCCFGNKNTFLGYTKLNIHEIRLRLFRGDDSLYIRAKMTSFVLSIVID